MAATTLDRTESSAIKTAVELSTCRSGAPFVVYRTPSGDYGVRCRWDCEDDSRFWAYMTVVREYLSGKEV